MHFFETMGVIPKQTNSKTVPEIIMKKKQSLAIVKKKREIKLKRDQCSDVMIVMIVISNQNVTIVLHDIILHYITITITITIAVTIAIT